MMRYALDPSYPSLRVSDLARIKVPLPSLSEQQRIVEILQEADKVRHLRAMAEGKTAMLIPGIFEARFGDPVANPRQWAVEPLANLIQGTPKNGLYKPSIVYGSGRPIIRIGDFYNGRLMNPGGLQRLQLSEKELSQFEVQNGDILVNRVNSIEFLGKSTLVAGLTEPTVFESNMMRLQMDREKLLPEFLIELLQHPSVLRTLRSRAKHAVNQASINQGDLLTLRLPKPPLNEQQAFLAETQAIDGINRANALADKSALLLSSSLLAHAFTGELTAEWREQHKKTLQQEASARDEALKAGGAELPPSTKIHEIEEMLARRTDGAYAELTREQHLVLEAIESGYGGVDYPRWFTAEEVAKSSLRGALRGNPQTIENHLSVLAARGLVIAVSREEENEKTGEIVYGNAYRLPLRSFEPREGEDREPVEGDDSRLREMQRLVARLEKERLQ